MYFLKGGSISGRLSNDRSIVCHFGFQFLLLGIQIVVRFSYDNFQTQMVVERKSISLSIAELHSSLTITHLTVGVKQRRLFMMSPHPSNVNDS